MRDLNDYLDPNDYTEDVLCVGTSSKQELLVDYYLFYKYPV